MKKIFALMTLIAMSLTLLISCGTVEETPAQTECTHEFKDATCTTPKTCSKCGETEGDVIAHTIENGACPTCGASLFEVMKLWDEKPGKSSNSDPVYAHYNVNDDRFEFGSGRAIEFGQEYNITGVSNPVFEYQAGGSLIITREGIENKTYVWELVVQKYDVDGHAYHKMTITGTLDASNFSEDSVLHMKSFSDPFNVGLTEDQAEEYVSKYATPLIWSAVTGSFAEFLSANGETPTVLGFSNYK
ncbi:MAG: hypothetical protein IJZ83_06370 [Clostridia bacterium]|nr:hypothetical protein [Clostridia bacterium]